MKTVGKNLPLLNKLEFSFIKRRNSQQDIPDIESIIAPRFAQHFSWKLKNGLLLVNSRLILYD